MLNLLEKKGARNDKVLNKLVGNEIVSLELLDCYLLVTIWLLSFQFMDVSLNWWFSDHSHGFNFSLSPRMLVHKLLTEIKDMSTPNIIFELKDKWSKTRMR